MNQFKLAVVAGVGPALGASVAEALADDGYDVVALSRSMDFIETLAERPPKKGGRIHAMRCDVSNNVEVHRTFESIRSSFGTPSVLVYNAHQLLIKPFLDTSIVDFESVWRVICSGAFNCAQQVVPGMVDQGHGSILCTGATASVRGGAKFAAFASAKFALRGLAQSLAREYGPVGVHVAHVLIDGLIWGDPSEKQHGAAEKDCISPAEIAKTYLHLINQDRSCWSHELDLRPDIESF